MCKMNRIYSLTTHEKCAGGRDLNPKFSHNKHNKQWSSYIEFITIDIIIKEMMFYIYYLRSVRLWIK